MGLQELEMPKMMRVTLIQQPKIPALKIRTRKRKKRTRRRTRKSSLLSLKKRKKTKDSLDPSSKHSNILPKTISS